MLQQVSDEKSVLLRMTFLTSLWRCAIGLLVVCATVGIVMGFGGRWSAVLDAIGYFRLHFAFLAMIGGVLAISLPRRRVKWIGFVAAALAVAMLGPVWRSIERPNDSAGRTRAVSVMTANVLGGSNPSLHLTSSVLMAADADVLAVVEAPPAWSKPTALLARHYPYRSAQPDGRNGVVLFSKFPLRRIEMAGADANSPAFATAFLDLGGGVGIGVTAVHLSWPLVANGAQAKQIAIIGSLLSAEAGPKVLVGDFNATPWSAAMSRVEANTGLSMVGGLRRTWLGGYPNPIRYTLTGSLYGNEVPALLGQHIDHVLLSPDTGVDGIEVIPLPGSDHRAVWARIQIPLRPVGSLFAGG